MIFSFGTYAIAQNKKSKTTPSATKKSTPVNTESKTESKPEVKTEAPKTGTLQSHGKEIQKIIKSENGVIRGYDFGTAKQKIKETEDAKYVADGKDFLIYHVKIDEKENAEIIYYLDENELVKGFGIAFLVNPTTMAENVEATLVDDFQNYFNERYGKYTVNSKNDEVWTSNDGIYTVEMGDSSEDESMLEIEIEIFKKK
jgi:hypothetical protein